MIGTKVGAAVQAAIHRIGRVVRWVILYLRAVLCRIVGAIWCIVRWLDSEIGKDPKANFAIVLAMLGFGVALQLLIKANDGMFGSSDQAKQPQVSILEYTTWNDLLTGTVFEAGVFVAIAVVALIFVGILVILWAAVTARPSNAQKMKYSGTWISLRLILVSLALLFVPGSTAVKSYLSYVDASAHLPAAVCTRIGEKPQLLLLQVRAQTAEYLIGKPVSSKDGEGVLILPRRQISAFVPEYQGGGLPNCEPLQGQADQRSEGISCMEVAPKFFDDTVLEYLKGTDGPNSLPEGESITEHVKESDLKVQSVPNLVLGKGESVDLIFHHNGASYTNILGWYLLDDAREPKAHTIKLLALFNPGQGKNAIGQYATGFKVGHLSIPDAGTSGQASCSNSIGFFLIANANQTVRAKLGISEDGLKSRSIVDLTSLAPARVIGVKDKQITIDGEPLGTPTYFSHDPNNYSRCSNGAQIKSWPRIIGSLDRSNPDIAFIGFEDECEKPYGKYPDGIDHDYNDLVLMLKFSPAGTT